MRIEFLKQFRGEVAKLDQARSDQLHERLVLFIQQPNHPFLRTHPLKGKLKGRWSINITGDIRAIYRIFRNKNKDDIIQFVRLGTHSELY